MALGIAPLWAEDGGRFLRQKIGNTFGSRGGRSCAVDVFVDGLAWDIRGEANVDQPSHASALGLNPGGQTHQLAD